MDYRHSDEALVIAAEATGWYAGRNSSSADRYRPVVREGRELRGRLLDYAASIVELVDTLPKTTIAGRRIGDQLLRSATSVGANYEEARAAESAADFHSQAPDSPERAPRIVILAPSSPQSEHDPSGASRSIPGRVTSALTAKRNRERK